MGGKLLAIMYKVYILKSLTKNRYYVGHSKDLALRLINHNQGKVRSTKAYTPWVIIYTEDYDTKQLAYAREMQIKSYKGGRAFKALIE